MTDIFETLAKRFNENINRHEGIEWDDVIKALKADTRALEIVSQMEGTGGEPDVISYENGSYIFCDCVKEIPKERMSLCYDEEALNKRKTNKPKGSAEGMVKAIGAELTDEAMYLLLQSKSPVDLKNSSWISTPEEVRRLGGAIFGDRRFNRVFIYHNGAESYYSSRGFRTYVKVKAV